jgi:hypothetical protein
MPTRCGGLLIALVALWSLGALGTDGATAHASSDGPYREDEAVRFRAEFGLSIEPDWLERVVRDRDADWSYGIPLAVTEAEDLRQRESLVRQLIPVQSRLAELSTFGGVWVDQAGGGLPVIARVGDDPEFERIVQDSPLSRPPRIVNVTWSLAQLEVLHSHIVADLDSIRLLGAEPVMVQTNVRENRVDLVVTHSPTATLAKLEATYGPMMKVTTTDGPVAGLACTRSNCPDPWKAGLELRVGTTPICTAGFVAREGTSQFHQLTAGHCGSVGTLYKHAGLNVGSVVENGWVNNSAADAALIDIRNDWKSNLVFLSTGNPLRSITSRQNPNDSIIGEPTCHSGLTTGYSCGTLKGVNITIIVSGRTMIRQRWASFPSMPGDSGAPVFFGSKAIGLVSTSHPQHEPQAIFSHIIEAENRLGVITQMTP